VRRLVSDAPVPTALIVVVLVAGLLLWWPPGSPPNRYSELGTALIGGGIVATAILVLEQSLSQRQQKRDLQLQLGLRDDFRGIDLRGVDLSGSYLAGKNFRGADLRGADLRGTNVSDANLTNTRLDRVDLRGAIMGEPPLYPSDNLMPSDALFPSSGLPDAITNDGTNFDGTKYDASTKWPSHITNPEELGEIKVLVLVSWGRWLFGG
jgi:hypothetical protein